MDADEVRRIARLGETFTVEFKRSTSAKQLNDRDLAKAAMCLANGDGGQLLIGVRDDGAIEGAAIRTGHGDKTDPTRLAATISNRLEPWHPVGVEVIDVDGADVIVVDVPAATGFPVGTTDGVFERRSLNSRGEPECVPFRSAELVSRAYTLQGLDWAQQPALGCRLDDLDSAEFDRFRMNCRPTDPALADASDRDVLLALRLLRQADRADVIGLGAVLMFGTKAALERWIPTAETLLQDVRTSTRQVNRTLRMPLMATLVEADAFVESRNTETELMFGIHRVGVPLVPQLAAREAIANALAHRDYAQLGSVAVRWTEEAFSVTSPGGLPPGVTLSNLLDSSQPRSPVIAEALKRAGLVERRGKGVNEMFDIMLRLGRAEPDYDRTTDATVVVELSTSSADLDMIRFVRDFEEGRQHALSLSELRVLHEVRASGSASLIELEEDLGVSRQVARGASTALVEAGLLEARGQGRNRRYHLSAAFYTHAMDRSAYVRIKGVSELQQRTMIETYLRTYGRVTRSQVAELCMVTPAQARAILKRMVNDGVLELNGERRTAFYTLADRDMSAARDEHLPRD